MKRVVIANFYPVWPPMGRGQRRIFFLARELAKTFDVELMVLDRMGVNKTTKFTRSFRETRVTADTRFRAFEHALEKRVKFSADIAYAMHWDECTIYNDLLAERAETADVMITAHPYSMYALQKARQKRPIPIVFDSQNVELRQKAPLFGENRDLVDALRQIESSALVESDRVIACSVDDAAAFGEDYGFDVSKIAIIENGVDAWGVPSVPEETRNQILDGLGLRDKLVAVFGGSMHFPNLRAVDRILDFARAAPDVVFLILGGVCNFDKLKSAVPANVIPLGEVDESVKWLAFAISDIGLNPMDLKPAPTSRCSSIAPPVLPR
ncbi:MAG: glycosyltransferase [Phyllobacteriaceae bacterium]|nr:glycosyltransferase [Phyllobacteriaceae bacterium]